MKAQARVIDIPILATGCCGWRNDGVVLASVQAASAAGDLAAKGYGFDLTLPDGEHLTSRDLVGAVIEIDDPAGHLVTARIDRLTPASERPTFSCTNSVCSTPAKGTLRVPCAGPITKDAEPPFRCPAGGRGVSSRTRPRGS